MNTVITSKNKAPHFGLNATILLALLGLLTLVALLVAAPYVGTPRTTQPASVTNAQIDYRPLDQHDRHPVDPYKVSVTSTFIEERQERVRSGDTNKASGTSTFIEERQERVRSGDTNNSASCSSLSDKIDQARCFGVK